MKKGFSVSKLKRRLILLLIIILLGWGWYYLDKVRPWEMNLPLVGRGKKLPDYEFQILSIREVSGEKIFYRVSANSLVLDRAQGVLEQVTGSILENNKPALNFTAHNGILEIGTKVFTFNDFSGQTVGRYRLPWVITSAQASWDNRVQKFTFTPKPRLTNGELNIFSGRMIYDLRFDIFSLEAGCEVQTKEYTLSGEQAAVRQAFNVLTVEKNVVLTGQDFQVRADYLDWFVREEELFFKNNVQLQTEDMILTATAVSLNIAADLIYLSDDVRMQTVNTTSNIIVNTGLAVWDRKENRVEFFAGTRAWKNNSLIESDQLVYDLQNNELLAAGGGRTKIIKTDN